VSGGKDMGGEYVWGVESRGARGGREGWVGDGLGGREDGEEGPGGDGRGCEGRGTGVHGDALNHALHQVTVATAFQPSRFCPHGRR